MSEKNSGIVKCTAAVTFERTKHHQVFKNGMPKHITMVPPFEMPEQKMHELLSAYYNTISPWAGSLYEDGHVTRIRAESHTTMFGTDQHPVPVRKVGVLETQEFEASDFLALRGMLVDDTKEVVGDKCSEKWVLGEFHVSEGDHDLGIFNSEFVAVDSLTVFVKRRGLWAAEETFGWED